MKFRNKFSKPSTLLGASALIVTVASGAFAQNALKPIPKPSDRRLGDLEGWSDSPKAGGSKAGGSRAGDSKAGAHKGKKSAKAAKPASGEPDGGIPLPTTRENPDDYAPVGFDKDGRLGTGMKF
ncbi:MAG: hypothetical protein ACK5JM_09640 [Rhodoblastus sp.]